MELGNQLIAAMKYEKATLDLEKTTLEDFFLDGGSGGQGALVGEVTSSDEDDTDLASGMANSTSPISLLDPDSHQPLV